MHAASSPRKTSAAALLAGLGRAVGHVFSQGLLRLIAAYQRFLSPVLPVVTLGACACRYSPTCSHYAAEAIRTHDALTGVRLAFFRLLRCNPWGGSGIDPVPPRRSGPARPTCVRSVSSPTASLS